MHVSKCSTHFYSPKYISQLVLRNPVKKFIPLANSNPTSTIKLSGTLTATRIGSSTNSEKA